MLSFIIKILIRLKNWNTRAYSTWYLVRYPSRTFILSLLKYLWRSIKKYIFNGYKTIWNLCFNNIRMPILQIHSSPLETNLNNFKNIVAIMAIIKHSINAITIFLIKLLPPVSRDRIYTYIPTLKTAVSYNATIRVIREKSSIKNARVKRERMLRMHQVRICWQIPGFYEPR